VRRRRGRDALHAARVRVCTARKALSDERNPDTRLTQPRAKKREKESSGGTLYKCLEIQKKGSRSQPPHTRCSLKFDGEGELKKKREKRDNVAALEKRKCDAPL
jgi:hypothetical protein